MLTWGRGDRQAAPQVRGLSSPQGAQQAGVSCPPHLALGLSLKPSGFCFCSKPAKDRLLILIPLQRFTLRSPGESRILDLKEHKEQGVT